MMLWSFRQVLRVTQARGRDVLALAIFVGLASAAMAQSSAALLKKATGVTTADAMVTIAQTKGYVRVIILFNSPVPPDAIRPDAASIANITSQVAAARDPILATHFGSAKNPAPGKGFPRSVTSFTISPGFAVNVSAQELEALAADPQILTIQHDNLEPPTLNESVPLIGAPAAYGAGATGSGQTVAVLDTGVKVQHEFLNGKVIAEACFSNAGGGGVSLCPNGSTSQTGTGAADANATNCNNAAVPSTNFNLCYHGTHVAGIAAGIQHECLAGRATERRSQVVQDFRDPGFHAFQRQHELRECDPSLRAVLYFRHDQRAELRIFQPEPWRIPRCIGQYEHRRRPFHWNLRQRYAKAHYRQSAERWRPDSHRCGQQRFNFSDQRPGVHFDRVHSGVHVEIGCHLLFLQYVERG